MLDVFLDSVLDVLKNIPILLVVYALLYWMEHKMRAAPALLDRAQSVGPVIGAIAQSGQNAVKPEKRALLGALKPFVAEEVSGKFDRALRLVSMARMARAALGQVNLSADDTAPRAL